jgi:hypothetical protein
MIRAWFRALSARSDRTPSGGPGLSSASEEAADG